MKLLKQAVRIKELEHRNAELFARNIIMAVELETIDEDPNSNRAKEIINKYRKRIEIRNEREQASQN